MKANRRCFKSALLAMMPAKHPYSVKEMLRNFFSIVAGVLTNFAVLISLVSFLLFSEILSWSDTSNEADELSSAYISFALALIIASIAGTYITAKISTRQHWLHISITTIIILLIFYLGREFSFGFSENSRILFLVVILPAALFGGYRGIRSKTKLLE